MPQAFPAPTPINLLVWGEAASFTRDDTPAERDTYPILTVPAAEAILRAIYWHPFFDYEVTAIHVMKPVEIYTWRSNELSKHAGKEGLDGMDLSNRALRIRRLIHQPEYGIQARLVIRPEVHDNHTFGKALGELLRRAGKGQCFERPYFGMREYPVMFRLLEDDEYLTPWDIDANLGFLPLIRHQVEERGGPMTFARFHHDAVTGQWLRQNCRGRLVSEYMPGIVEGGTLAVPRYRSAR